MSQPVDAALIGRLFDRHARALSLYAAQWTSAADDCVQEAFIELARQPLAPDSPAAWLFRVVRNRALNAARDQRRRVDREQAAGATTTGRHSMAANPAEAAGLRDLLATLARRQREIIILKIWGQRTYQEIAELMGASRSGVHREYAEALGALRKHLDPDSCPKNNPCPTS